MDTASKAPIDAPNISSSCSQNHPALVEQFLCSHCGGNGYMKTTPNCYHTCLECLGRGIVYGEEHS